MIDEFEFQFFLRGTEEKLKELEKHEYVQKIEKVQKTPIASFLVKAATVGEAVQSAKEVVKSFGLETFAITYDESYT